MVAIVFGVIIAVLLLFLLISAYLLSDVFIPMDADLGIRSSNVPNETKQR